MVIVPLTGEDSAVIYCRVSTPGQADADDVERADGEVVERETSLDTQEAACRAFAAQQGWDVEYVYHDVYSGYSLAERPGLTALRERIAAGGITHVVTYSVDRLSRRMGVVSILDDEFGDVDCDLIFVTERFGPGSDGKLLTLFYEWQAEREREKINDRTMRGKMAKSRAGALLPGCRPRYGYHWIDQQQPVPTDERPDQKKRRRQRAPFRRYAINQNTGPVVQQIFAWAAAGDPLRSIAQRLTNMQVPTPTRRGAVWVHTTVRGILSDEQYVGKGSAFHLIGKPARHKSGQKYKRLTVRPEDQQIALPDGTIPPLVDVETFEVVQARLRRNKAESTRNNKHPERMLLRAGFIFCGYCGRAMNVQGTVDYRCAVSNARGAGRCPGGPTISATIADRVAWEKVRAVLSDPAIVAREIERRATDDGAADRDVARLDKLLTDLDQRRRNLTANLALLDPQSAGDVRALLQALSTERQGIETERAEALTRRERRQTELSLLEGVQTWQLRVGANLDDADYRQRRDMLEATGFRMRVWRKDHSPRWEVTLDIDPDALLDSTSGRSVHKYSKGSDPIRLVWADGELV